jgi:hypothetical protein
MKIQKLEGRDHYIAPVIMAVEGVLNGSNGPLYYPADELEKSAHLWNGRPVVVYHPAMYSNGFAGSPEIFNRQKIGTIFNARVDGTSLKAEAWLDIDRLKSVDKRVLQAVKSDSMMEVSTGLIVDTDDCIGVFNGKEYQAIARNYRPDHLAILPDMTGACSIVDGAGLCRNLQSEEALLIPATL